MAIKKSGKAPAARAKPESSSAAVSESAVLGTIATDTVKLTVSIKRRLSNGDEVFIAPGVEMHCAHEDVDATKEKVTASVNAWMEELLSQYPDVDPIDAADEEDEEDEEDEAEEDDADEEEELTDDDIKAMKKPELVALAKEMEIELESTTVAKMRDELIEALFDEEEEDEDADEDEEDEDEDEADEDEEELTEEDLKAMKLDELQTMCDEYEIDHPKLKKGAKLPEKKAAYVKHIMESLEEE